MFHQNQHGIRAGLFPLAAKTLKKKSPPPQPCRRPLLLPPHLSPPPQPSSAAAYTNQTKTYKPSRRRCPLQPPLQTKITSNTKALPPPQIKTLNQTPPSRQRCRRVTIRSDGHLLVNVHHRPRCCSRDSSIPAADA
jgi:hypothetical protein